MKKMNSAIYLIRHARPILDRSGLFSKAQAEQYLTAYQVAEVGTDLEKTPHLPLKRIQKVFCSPLPRALATAHLLFGRNMTLVVDRVFREFENRIWGIPWGKFPMGWWQVSSRVLWMLGVNQGDSESFRQAKARAARAAAILAQEAGTDGLAVLVAHGFLNAFIKRALRKQGWKVTLNGSSSYLGVTILEKQFPF